MIRIILFFGFSIFISNISFSQTENSVFLSLKKKFKEKKYQEGLEDALSVDFSQLTLKESADLSLWILKYKVILKDKSADNLFSKSEEQTLNTYGEQSIAFGTLRYWQGLHEYQLENDDKAGEYWIHSKKIFDKIPESKDLSVYESLILSLGNFYYVKGKHKQAIEWYEIILSKIENRGNQKHPLYIRTLKNTSYGYSALGEFDKAISLIKKAQQIAKEKLPDEVSMHVALHNLLGKEYYKTGRDDLVEEQYLTALKILETHKLQGDASYPTILSNLAVFYETLGMYRKAEKLFYKSLQSKIKIIGRETGGVSDVLDNLGNISISLGQYEKAREYFEEAYGIYEKLKGKDHPWTAWTGFDFSQYFIAVGDYEEAERLITEGLRVYKKVYGENHINYQARKITYGNLLFKKGQYEEAKEWVESGIDSVIQKYTKVHSRSASALLLLGKIHEQTGDLVKAEKLITESESLYKKVYNELHPSYLRALEKVCEINYRRKNFEILSKNLLTLSNSSKHIIAKGTDHLSLSELYNYMNLFEGRFDKIAAYVIEEDKNLSSLNKLVANNSILYKGFLLDKSVSLERVSSKSSPQILEKYEDWQKLRSYLSKFYSSSKIDSEVISKLEAQAESLEKELIDNMSQFKNLNNSEIGFEEIKNLLAKDEVALDFISYRNPEDLGQKKYAAIIIKSNEANPKIISLFEEADILKLFHDDKKRTAKYVASLYAQAENRGLKVNEKQIPTLFELIWKPLEKELNGVSKIYFCPTGLLHKINMGAIPVKNDEIISDSYDLIRVNNFRQLKKDYFFDENQFFDNRFEAILYGGLSFGEFSEEKDLVASRSSDTRGSLLLYDKNSTLRGESWNFLPNTKKEITNISNFLKNANLNYQTLIEKEGTEESFKTIGSQKPSPKVLHIATHGFFFPDPKHTKNTDEALSMNNQPFQTSDHPMIRSGLVLSDGNQAWKTGLLLKDREEDGILTAYEISQMDLSNTELVVLSACDTGLGDIRGNEGVFGLQRAFKLAGAKYLIMSLWRVPDKQTSVLMTKFYEKMINQKLSVPQAFRAAQKEMHEMGFDRYQWAGFILIE